jgi:hypothetical protein
LVFRKLSKEWSVLFEVNSDFNLIDEPLIDIVENTDKMRVRLRERERESDSVSVSVTVDDEIVKISKISDRLFCLYRVSHPRCSIERSVE